MKKFSFVFALLIATACSSQKNSPDNSQGNNSKENETVDDSQIKNVQHLLQDGDQSACVDKTVKDAIIEKLTPDFLPTTIQQRILRESRLYDQNTISEQDWYSISALHSNFDREVMSDFNSQTKAMECEAVFKIGNSEEYPVRYTLQPTADGESFVFKVNSQALTDESRRILQYNLTKSYVEMRSIEGDGEIEISDQGDAQQFSESQNKLIEEFFALESLCRGGTNSQKTEKDCLDRDNKMEQIRSENICYGKSNQFSYQYKMHICGTDSNG